MLRLATLFLTLLPAAQDGGRPLIQPLANPAGERSQLPNLALGPDGAFLLSWVEPGEDGASRLCFAESTPEGWSEPRTIAQGKDWFVNWADFPSIAALPDGTLAAHWLARVGVEAYAYGVQVGLSLDGGATWSAPVVPHRDRSPTEHGFVSMAPIDGDRFAIVWLDGRAMASKNGSDEMGEMSLRTTTIDRAGALGEERVIDPRVCECCQTAAAAVGGRVLVAYRDRGEEEVRDCALSFLSADAITTPAMVHADGWKHIGCPVNGPALAARGEEVAVAWYTEAKGRPQLLLARSTDGGKTFGEPVSIDDGNPVGRVDLATHPDGGWLAVWLERGDGGGEVRGRSIIADGTVRPSVLIARTSAERASGFPRLERSGRRVVIAWTEVTEVAAGAAAPAPRVRTADLVFPEPEKEKGAE